MSTSTALFFCRKPSHFAKKEEKEKETSNLQQVAADKLVVESLAQTSG